MPIIRPIYDLRNYTDVLKEMCYGERTYLMENGHGEFVLIDMKEADDLEKMHAFHKLMENLYKAEERADREGWISEEEADRILVSVGSIIE